MEAIGRALMASHLVSVNSLLYDCFFKQRVTIRFEIGWGVLPTRLHSITTYDCTTQLYHRQDDVKGFFR
jgi:hypothetical protein